MSTITKSLLPRSHGLRGAEALTCATQQIARALFEGSAASPAFAADGGQRDDEPPLGEGVMNWRSIWAVLAGALVGIVVTTLIDIGLHKAGVFPPIDQPIDDALALPASAYRVLIGVGSAWLTARLAPKAPMRHALILGVVGAAAALVGVVATWNLGLGPRWYPLSLVIVAIPQSWAGGKIFELQSSALQPVRSGP